MLKSLFLATLLLSLSGMAFADSFWHHNGSVMRLTADNNGRTFYYEVPSAKMKKAGVKADMLLFDGQREGNYYYYGTAYVFSKDCAEPLSYDVAGTVKNETTIALTGSREIYAKGCRPTGKMTTDTLVFTYQYSD